VRILDELIKLVSQKTGLSEEMARKAVETVIGYLKKELPEPIASQIDSVLTGGGVSGDLGETAQGLLGGLFGKK
jgi:hypothetical protein